MQQTNNLLDGKQILDVVLKYREALDLLDDYDHQKISKLVGSKLDYVFGCD